MNRTFLTYASLLIILVFIGYMVYDSVRPAGSKAGEVSSVSESGIEDAWNLSSTIAVKTGKLAAVAVSVNGNVFAGGDSFVSCYKDDSGSQLWTISTPSPVTALAAHGDSVYAATVDQVLVISGGKIVSEWGPYEANCIFTSVSVSKSRVAVCDAGNRKVFILDKGGEMVAMAGQDNPRFVLPSAYFDIVINDDNSFWVANTGHRRIEKRSSEGIMDSYFGEAGLAPNAFCGCCNPAHFTVIPGGFITAEKGINRIKILNNNGQFTEFVSSDNDFEPAIPLDIASADGRIIYAANKADSKIYVYKRKSTSPPRPRSLSEGTG